MGAVTAARRDPRCRRAPSEHPGRSSEGHDPVRDRGNRHRLVRPAPGLRHRGRHAQARGNPPSHRGARRLRQARGRHLAQRGPRTKRRTTRGDRRARARPAGPLGRGASAAPAPARAAGTPRTGAAGSAGEAPQPAGTARSGDETGGAGPSLESRSVRIRSRAFISWFT